MAKTNNIYNKLTNLGGGYLTNHTNIVKEIKYENILEYPSF